MSFGDFLYVCDKFVRHQATGIYNIPWPAKNCRPKPSFKSVCQSANNTEKLPSSPSCQKTSKKPNVNYNNVLH